MDVEVVANYVTKGSTEYSIAFVRDITDRKRVERDLIHKNEELNGAYEQLASVEQENSGAIRRTCKEPVPPGGK